MAGIYALLAFLTVCEALQQGPLTWALREFVPVLYRAVKLKKYTGPALHFLGTLPYLAVAFYLAYGTPALTEPAYWLAVLLLRFALFDPVLNLTKSYLNGVFGRGVEPLFAVGTSALTDQALQWVASRLRWNASVLSGALRLLAALGLAALWIL